ncbi:MAG: XRE family transcriptional regulator [Mariprofundaceae bacterium]
MSEETWVNALRKACEKQSQSTVARDISYSPAVVNQVLKGAYKGDLKAVQQAVEGALMKAVVNCPVLGELASNVCLENQRKPFAAINPIRVRLFSACKTCENRRNYDH